MEYLVNDEKKTVTIKSCNEDIKKFRALITIIEALYEGYKIVVPAKDNVTYIPYQPYNTPPTAPKWPTITYGVGTL